MSYIQEYYKTHKVALRAQRKAKQAAARQDAALVARGPWLRALLKRHHLTQVQCARLLGVSAHHITAWVCRVDAASWEPIPDTRYAQLRDLLPEDAPMRHDVLMALQYHAAWGILPPQEKGC